MVELKTRNEYLHGRKSVIELIEVYLLKLYEYENLSCTNY